MLLWSRTAIFFVANLVIPAILLYPVFRKSSMFWITVCGFAACTLIYVGVRYNELVFKTSGIFYFFLAILCTQAFPMLGKIRKFLLVAYIALCSIFPIKVFMHYAKTFAVTPEAIQKNIRNEWNGSLYHPEDIAYWSIVKKLTPFEELLFYSREGESAEGVMAWCRTGRNMNTPIQPPAEGGSYMETPLPQDR